MGIDDKDVTIFLFGKDEKPLPPESFQDEVYDIARRVSRIEITIAGGKGTVAVNNGRLSYNDNIDDIDVNSAIQSLLNVCQFDEKDQKFKSSVESGSANDFRDFLILVKECRAKTSKLGDSLQIDNHPKVQGASIVTSLGPFTQLDFFLNEQEKPAIYADIGRIFRKAVTQDSGMVIQFGKQAGQKQPGMHAHMDIPGSIKDSLSFFPNPDSESYRFLKHNLSAYDRCRILSVNSNNFMGYLIGETRNFMDRWGFGSVGSIWQSIAEISCGAAFAGNQAIMDYFFRSIFTTNASSSDPDQVTSIFTNGIEVKLVDLKDAMGLDLSQNNTGGHFLLRFKKADGHGFVSLKEMTDTYGFDDETLGQIFSNITKQFENNHFRMIAHEGEVFILTAKDESQNPMPDWYDVERLPQ